MARSRKDTDKNDAVTLRRLRLLMIEADCLSNQLSTQVPQATRALIRHGVELVSAQAKEAHESAHFGATGALLPEKWSEAGVHVHEPDPKDVKKGHSPQMSVCTGCGVDIERFQEVGPWHEMA